MDDDEDNLCRFGTPLKPYEEDEIPSKRPIAVEDMIVKDANGKRRFHGAFTGGFSAGFWNTVGSLEGWKPSQFKSTRSEKAGPIEQKPTDFMDEEDQSEFGFAPQRIQTQDDFASGSSGSGATKRKYEKPTLGPIPGVPVLKTLLEPAKDKAAVRILKKMGWRPGQGVGARLTRREKRQAAERNAKEVYVMKKYGCDLGPMARPAVQAASDEEETDDSDLSDYEVTFAPDDFDPYVITAKDNLFGLGYSGLDRNPVLKQQQHINLFDTFEVVDRTTNKKLSIRGQAFGVGALEEEDEDIYSKDDMSRYDFSLEDQKAVKTKRAIKGKEAEGVLEGFCRPKEQKKFTRTIFKIEMPENFRPRNWTQRRSRFEPLDPRKAKVLEEKSKYKREGLGRHDLDPVQRGQLLGEKPKHPILEAIHAKASNFTSGEVLIDGKETTLKPAVVEENKAVQKEAEKITKSMPSSTGGVFKPFAGDPDKQERYEKFLEFKESKEKPLDVFLRDLQPFHMSEWDREMEKKEFLHAKRLYKPLAGLMSDRFVTESSIEASKTETEKSSSTEPPPAKKEIKMKRTKVMWKPHKDLCKRFNVPEPFGGLMVEEKPKKKSTFSVFDYLEAPVNSRRDFVAPSVIPKKVPNEKKPKWEPPKVTAKEFFNEEDRPAIPSTSKVEPESPKKPPPASIPAEEKSELELEVEKSVNKPPQEKKDLFKAIFCDSSDDESDKEGEKAPEKPPKSEQDKLKLVESFVATKPASEINILRNTSPPRGVFKNMFEVVAPPPPLSFDKKDSLSGSSSSDEEGQTPVYGPKPPPKPLNPQKTTSVDPLDEKLINLLQKSSVDSSKKVKIVEKWVEKDKVSSSSSKKKSKKSKKSSKHRKKEKRKHKDKR